MSRANLIRGEWNKDTFMPYNTGVIWQDAGTSAKIKEKGLYILRPEDIILTASGRNTLNGTIMTRQFQGKEYQYSVETENHGTIMVNTGINEVFSQVTGSQFHGATLLNHRKFKTKVNSILTENIFLKNKAKKPQKA